MVDTLDTAGGLPVRLSWHLGPDVAVELDGALARLAWEAAGDRRQASLALPDELRWTTHRGEQEDVLGWYSPGFGRRVPATSLVGEGTGTAATRLVTTLTFFS